MQKKAKLFLKAKKKLAKDLDVGGLINIVHSYDVFLKVLFEDWERIFLNF